MILKNNIIISIVVLRKNKELIHNKATQSFQYVLKSGNVGALDQSSTLSPINSCACFGEFKQTMAGIYYLASTVQQDLTMGLPNWANGLFQRLIFFQDHQVNAAELSRTLRFPLGKTITYFSSYCIKWLDN